MKQFNWHCDDAHEWLEVDIDYLKISGLAEKISSYSYYSKKTNTAYLEGDMDAGILYEYMGKNWDNGNAPVIDHGHPNYNTIIKNKRQS